MTPKGIRRDCAIGGRILKAVQKKLGPRLNAHARQTIDGLCRTLDEVQKLDDDALRDLVTEVEGAIDDGDDG